jgi:P27 family predicted phage terminase small subunit
MPDMPDHLCPDGQAEWIRICDGLHHMGVLTEVDQAALGAYCTSYALWVQAWRAIKHMQGEGKIGAGLMIKTSNGTLVQNPLVGIANKSSLNMVKFAAEFGMTPAARAKIELNPQGEDDRDVGLKALVYGKKKQY